MATLVTAFYPIKSKFPSQQYMEWARTYMRIAAPIVLFTPASIAPLFRTMREDRPITIVEMEFEELDVWKLYKDQWIVAHEMDHERDIHTPELYAIWAQKAFFVEEAIRRNPFNTEYFFWCDVGAFRDPNILDCILRTFPQNRHLPPDKILMSCVNPLEDPMGDYTRKNVLVGGLWGGGKRGCLRWKSAYEEMLLRYFAEGKFAGKDQTVMLSAYVEDPSLAEIVRCNVADTNPWFYLEILLSEIPNIQIPKQLEPSFQIERISPLVSVKIQGGLGNQMFQIATAYAVARQQGVVPQFLREKLAEDGRAMYWDSVLHRFQHMVVDRIQTYHNAPLQVWYERSATEYTPIPSISPPGVFIDGYVQSSKYFGDATIREEIRSLFQPSARDLKRIEEKYGDLLEIRDRVVVVHARRTDYLKSEWNIQFHGPLTAEYYKEAISRMCEAVKNPVFLLCSDDPMFWVQIMSEIPALHTHPFRILMEETDVNTLTLLQQFKYFVLANSTFSWWFTWLAKSPEKVIAPAKWFGPRGPQTYEDIYEEGWIRM